MGQQVVGYSASRRWCENMELFSIHPKPKWSTKDQDYSPNPFLSKKIGVSF